MELLEIKRKKVDLPPPESITVKFTYEEFVAMVVAIGHINPNALEDKVKRFNIKLSDSRLIYDMYYSLHDSLVNKMGHG